MKLSLRKGVSFGLTSGIITTIGLIVGLYSATSSKLAVIGGIITIAIADSMSDALGIHISEEAEHIHTCDEVWESTFATFLSKFVLALIFIIPVLMFSLMTAVIISVIFGMLILSFLSFKIAKKGKSRPVKAIFEHLIIAIIVIILTYYLGRFVSLRFA